MILLRLAIAKKGFLAASAFPFQFHPDVRVLFKDLPEKECLKK
jgi:hypothetical protein